MVVKTGRQFIYFKFIIHLYYVVKHTNSIHLIIEVLIDFDT